jgi:large repetitive protein
MRAMRWVGWTVVAGAVAMGGAPPAAHAAEGNLLAGTVWWDVDYDGCICATEPGLAGVDIAVTAAGDDETFDTDDDIGLPPSTTDATGAWSLSGLDPGWYRVEVVGGVPAGMTPTHDADDPFTSDPVTPLAAELQVPDEEDAVTVDEVDFGVAGDGIIGGRLWLDQDADGIEGEPLPPPSFPVPEWGLAGIDVIVTWHGPDGALGGGDDLAVAATTGGFGEYSATGLPFGTFTVAVDQRILPSTMVPTHDLDGGADHTASVALSEASRDRDDVDFGYRGTSAIGGRVVWDRDGSDGITPTDAGLVGFPLFAVWLGPDGEPETADDVPLVTLTGPDGVYRFEGVPAGHVVVVGQPSLPGFALTFDEDGGLDGIIDADLAAHSAHSTADFGYAGEGTIGDVVYLDANGDGVQSSGEPGVAGQRVDLHWFGPECGCEDIPDNDIVVSTTTDANGNYLFERLFDGLYRVSVVGGLADAATNTGDPDADLPEDLPNESYTELYVDGDTGTEHRIDLDQDFGYLGTSTLGDTVWLDVNADGVRQATEPGVAGVGVTATHVGPDGAFGTMDDVDSSTTTDAAGVYLFAQLVAGRYRVAVAAPASMTSTADSDGGRDGVALVDLGADEANTVQNFGLAGTGSLSGTVFNDADRDGTPDGGETGVPGVIVLVDWNRPGGAVALAATTVPGGPLTLSAVTGADGAWRIDQLPAGDYTVRLDPATLPAGFTGTTAEDVALVLAGGATSSVAHGVALQASPPVPPTTDPPSTPAPAELPATGGNRSGPATLAAVLVALGLAVLGLASTRRRVS